MTLCSTPSKRGRHATRRRAIPTPTKLVRRAARARHSKCSGRLPYPVEVTPVFLIATREEPDKEPLSKRAHHATSTPPPDSFHPVAVIMSCPWCLAPDGRTSNSREAELALPCSLSDRTQPRADCNDPPDPFGHPGLSRRTIGLAQCPPGSPLSLSFSPEVLPVELVVYTRQVEGTLRYVLHASERFHR